MTIKDWDDSRKAWTLDVQSFEAADKPEEFIPKSKAVNSLE
jgi:hypothetical protein